MTVMGFFTIFENDIDEDFPRRKRKEVPDDNFRLDGEEDVPDSVIIKVNEVLRPSPDDVMTAADCKNRRVLIEQLMTAEEDDLLDN